MCNKQCKGNGVCPKFYANMVEKLAKDGKDIVEGLTVDTAHLLHMAVGLSGETSELVEAMQEVDREHILEELGDIEFYLQGIYNGINSAKGITSESFELELKDEPPAYLQLVIIGGNLLDTVKKAAIYNKELDFHQLNMDLMAYEYYLVQVHNLYGFTSDVCRKHNVNKLSKRYSSGTYSNKQAQQRADKQEGE